MLLLIADHDPDFADITAYALRRVGFDVRVVTPDGETALRIWSLERFDAALLDVRLKKISGLDVCRQIKQQSDVPVIITGDSRRDDIVADVFTSGADDYVVKPCSYKVLELRLRAVSRRMNGTDIATIPHELRQGNLVLNLEFQRATVQDREVGLTRAETRLLFELLKDIGRPVTFERLACAVWGLAGNASDPARLRIHACNLRRKLGLTCSGPRALSVVQRTGYILTLDEDGVRRDVSIVACRDVLGAERVTARTA